ncbi:hypothetical protein LO762_20475 [Actinocorallia sp. API 0066]|uniref:hypothetical protein n=1 Tax=Actinocorallia sp. API 0066 TaxID=2896846 RepID=UPI001E2FE0BA|nr:hypothetical protein [Actinocorallia sp. API 0066]MCD0451552.1 hypothetical protein [Actinocorallia sp. API 0066]
MGDARLGDLRPLDALPAREQMLAVTEVRGYLELLRAQGEAQTRTVSGIRRYAPDGGRRRSP